MIIVMMVTIIMMTQMMVKAQPIKLLCNTNNHNHDDLQYSKSKKVVLAFHFEPFLRGI